MKIRANWQVLEADFKMKLLMTDSKTAWELSEKEDAVKMNLIATGWLVECCFTSTETVGTESKDSHLDFRTAPELCEGGWLVECCFTSTETVGLSGTGSQAGHLNFHTSPELCCHRQRPGACQLRIKFSAHCIKKEARKQLWEIKQWEESRPMS